MNGRNRNQFSIRSVELVLVILLSTACSSPFPEGVYGQENPDEKIAAQILGATVQINIINPTQVETEKVIGYSLGSLIQMGDEAVLVTHNHYKDTLQDQTEIEIRDAENGLIVRMSGSQFKNRIVYQDAGTLILQAPAELKDFQKKGASLRSGGPVKPGEVVYLAHRRPDDWTKLGVRMAVVEAVSVHAGLPTYQLRSLDGRPIVEGESGGGVWQHGQLVGNLWYAIMIRTITMDGESSSVTGSPAQPVMETTDLGFAAIYPK